MIIYNVTVNVNDEIREAWLQWMRSKHLAEIMATGCFVEYKMLHLLTEAPDASGTTYAIQYFALDMDSYERYRDEFGPALKAEGVALFGEQFTAFRTLLEVI